MKKKSKYAPPAAEIILLAPCENLALIEKGNSLAGQFKFGFLDEDSENLIPSGYAAGGLGSYEDQGTGLVGIENKYQ